MQQQTTDLEVACCRFGGGEARRRHSDLFPRLHLNLNSGASLLRTTSQGNSSRRRRQDIATRVTARLSGTMSTSDTMDVDGPLNLSTNRKFWVEIQPRRVSSSNTQVRASGSSATNKGKTKEKVVINLVSDSESDQHSRDSDESKSHSDDLSVADVDIAEILGEYKWPDSTTYLYARLGSGVICKVCFLDVVNLKRELTCVANATALIQCISPFDA